MAQVQTKPIPWAQHVPAARAGVGRSRHTKPKRGSVSLGLNMDPVAGGLKVVGIVPNGLAAQSDRVFVGDTVLEINDAEVDGRNAQQLAALVELNAGPDGNGACVLLLRRPSGKQARVVLDMSVPLPVGAPVAEDECIATDERLSHHAPVAADSAGVGLTLGAAEGRGGLPILELAPLGSARWSGAVARGDLLTHIDGAPVAHLAPDAAAALLAGARGAAPHCVLTLQRGAVGASVDVELSRAHHTASVDSLEPAAAPHRRSSGGSGSGAVAGSSTAEPEGPSGRAMADVRAGALDALRDALRRGASFGSPLLSLPRLPPEEAAVMHAVCEQARYHTPAPPPSPTTPGACARAHTHTHCSVCNCCACARARTHTHCSACRAHPAHARHARAPAPPPPLPPSRTNRTRLVPPPVLSGHVLRDPRPPPPPSRTNRTRLVPLIAPPPPPSRTNRTRLVPPSRTNRTRLVPLIAGALPSVSPSSTQQCPRALTPRACAPQVHRLQLIKPAAPPDAAAPALPHPAALCGAQLRPAAALHRAARVAHRRLVMQEQREAAAAVAEAARQRTAAAAAAAEREASAAAWQLEARPPPLLVLSGHAASLTPY